MKPRRVEIMVEGESDMPIKEIKDIFNFHFTDREISGEEVSFKTLEVRVNVIKDCSIKKKWISDYLKRGATK